MRHNTRDRVGLEDLARFTSLLGTGLCTLLGEREGGFTNQREHNLGLVALVNVLVYAFPMTNLGRR